MLCKLKGCGRRIPYARKSYDKSFCSDDHRTQAAKTSAKVARETDALMETRWKTRRDWIQIGIGCVSTVVGAAALYLTHGQSPTLKRERSNTNNRLEGQDARAQAPIQRRYE